MKRRPRFLQPPRSGSARSLVLALALAGGAAWLFKPNERLAEGQAYVIDGDTIQVNGVRIRIKGIDAPELHQTCSRAGETYRCGQTARSALIALVSHSPIQCRSLGRDRYQRMLARCTLDGRDIGAALVEEGWAVSYGKDYDREETRARSRSAGLWAGDFVRPQDWRRDHMREP